MTLFLLLVNYIAALVAVQLLRGDMAEGDPMNFGQVFTSFLAMYQVFSSENWVDILYGATHAEVRLSQTVVVAFFVTAWMLFANCEYSFLLLFLSLPLFFLFFFFCTWGNKETNSMEKSSTSSYY